MKASNQEQVDQNQQKPIAENDLEQVSGGKKISYTPSPDIASA